MSVIPTKNFSPDLLRREDYDRLAWEYYETLPLEHFMEATPQSTQKQITASSLALLALRCDDLQYFSELLIQYPLEGGVGNVVPDLMVVLGAEVIGARSSYPITLEAALPLMVHEYVSPSTQAKDYPPERSGDVTSFVKYEQHLQIPYYVVFNPEGGDLRVYHHDGQEYIRMEPNPLGRIRIEDLDVEIGLHGGWMRIWQQGELLPIPVELASQMEEMKIQLQQVSQENTSLKGKVTSLKGEVTSLRSHNASLAKEKEIAAQKSLERLRKLVITLAEAAGRDDIVQNALTADERQLDNWFDELEA